MAALLSCPAVPGPLEDYAARFDPLWRSPAQRRGFRAYLAGLLLPRDRNKTLTALAGAEPVVEAQAAAVQRLQFFLSEAHWDTEAVNVQRLALLAEQPALAAHADGVLVLDDTGDRKDGHATDHVARQYLGSVGKIDNGIVAVTSLWADGQCYWPVHVEPYTPARRLAGGKGDAQFRTKPAIALTLVERAQAAGIAFRAVVADSAYGDNDSLEATLIARGIPHVLAHRGRAGQGWALAEDAHSFEEAARDLPKRAWKPVTRCFRDGHRETWWAAEMKFLGYGPSRAARAIVATTDPLTLPDLTTWYLSTNLKLTDASLAEVVRLYGLRNWIEDHYKRVKDELGWADFMVRADHAIRRHWTLVNCAFSFCWWHEVRQAAMQEATDEVAPKADPIRPTVENAPPTARGKNQRAPRSIGMLATGVAARPRLARALEMAHRLLAGLEQQASTSSTRRALGRRHLRRWVAPLPARVTKYR